MTKIPPKEVKLRTKKLSEWFQAYETYSHKLNEIHEVLVTEVAHDNEHYVGHNKFYEQVLVPKKDRYMGKILKVKVIATKKHCLIGEPIDEGFSPAVAPIANGNLHPESSCNGKSFVSVPNTLILVVLAIIARVLWFYFKIGFTVPPSVRDSVKL